jgi:hypothetical protein
MYFVDKMPDEQARLAEIPGEENAPGASDSGQ